jgi:hypothetical protein
MEKDFSKKLKSVILSVTIAIVLSAFVIYFLNSIYPNPRYDDFCGQNERLYEKPTVHENQTICEEYGGIWKNGWCDYTHECMQEYEKAREAHDLVALIVSTIAGITALTMGIILALPSVSSGLMLGGTFLIIFGTGSYWQYFNNWIRTIILGIALTILIWLGYKKLQN